MSSIIQFIVADISYMEQTTKQALPSLRDIHPAEDGGRVSRRGFIYQDHVGASFCLDLLENNNLVEVWFEHHDDLVLVWNGEVEIFEFVQVKNEDLSSRYSVASLARRDSGVGTSLLEKSLNRSRCNEPTRFRLVTSYGIKSELNPLRYPPGSPERSACKDKIEKLKRELRGRLADAQDAEDGTTLEDWVDRCYWDKRAEEGSALANENILRLEAVLKKVGILALPDQRDEIYNKLLALVQKLAGPEGATDYQIGAKGVNETLERAAERYRRGSANLENLERKLQDAGLPRDYIEGAKDILRSYQFARLQGRYSHPLDFGDLEAEVIAELNLMKSRLDTGKMVGGVDFHSACLEALEEIREEQADRKAISKATLQGIMYFSANRCIHRFTEAKP